MQATVLLVAGSAAPRDRSADSMKHYIITHLSSTAKLDYSFSMHLTQPCVLLVVVEQKDESGYTILLETCKALWQDGGLSQLRITSYRGQWH